MNRLLPLFAILLVASCATTDDSDRRPPRRVAASELTLPNAWWHDPAIAEPLELSSDQFQRLDALRAAQDEIGRLEDDEVIAARDFRTALEANAPSATEIVAAGKRMRETRDALLAQQIQVLAAQREILTADQWRTLHRELTEDRMDRRQMRRDNGGMDGGRRGGGMGGGGGGRRPW
jgi:Spy/CpxP family protein refolding chaperone